jgi:uncharacterized protein (TIGR02569 family)
VLTAFEVEGPPERLPGGQGGSWRADGLVLKPVSGPVHEWLSEALTGLESDEVRVARPVRSRDGAWSHDGWSATSWVDGTEPDHASPGVSIEVIEAGRAFHRATARWRRPACLHARADPWAVADRAAWGELSPALVPELAAVADRLRTALGPLGPAQLVHGDLTGNVLFAPGLRPVVIDVAPYWRPAAYAEAVVVADALCWHGADADLVDDAGASVAAVARALLFRLVTTNERHLAGAAVDLNDEVRRCQVASEALRL